MLPDRLAPFRPGLLSVLLYGAPAVLLAGGVLARTRRGRAAYAAVTAGVLALAIPVQLLQQAVMAWEWTHAAGVPSRAWLQAIDVPGMPGSPASGTRARGRSPRTSTSGSTRSTSGETSRR